MRHYFEELEEAHLAPYAIKSATSKGRSFFEPPSLTRTCFQRDRDRIIHSKSFRRLKDKTQVFVATVSDDYRSRLTHTIEVAQLSRHLARLLKLNEDLTECIALAHDLGHSPFGHGGEEELNRLLNASGGFEHNLHSLRIVEEIEQKYPHFIGLNLSYEVREGLKKHHTPWDNPTQRHCFMSLETQVANIADEIAYNNHDIDDGLSSGILNLDDLILALQLFKDADTAIRANYTCLENHQLYHLINSHIISKQLMNVFQTSLDSLAKTPLTSVSDIQYLNAPIIGFDAAMHQQNKDLRKYLYTHFYRNPAIMTQNTQGQTYIRALFHFFKKNLSLIPKPFFSSTVSYPTDTRIGYYIASLTDASVHRLIQTYCLD